MGGPFLFLFTGYCVRKEDNDRQTTTILSRTKKTQETFFRLKSLRRKSEESSGALRVLG
jgi:hypothetical protein